MGGRGLERGKAPGRPRAKMATVGGQVPDGYHDVKANATHTDCNIMHECINLQSYILCVRIPPHPQTASHVSLAHKCCAGWASSSAGGLPKGGAPPGLSCEHNTYPMCFSKHKPRLNKHAVVQPTSWPTNVGLTHSPLAGHPPYSNACTRNLRHPASLG